MTTKKMKWATFNYLEFQVPEQCVADCAHQGQCDDDVEFWVKKLDLKLDPEKVRKELSEYGSWDDEELKDDKQNLHRLLWIACSNIKDEDFERDGE